MGKQSVKFIDQKRFGQAIADRRKQMQMTQAELANRVEILPTSIGYYEKGSSMPSLDTTFKIAEVLNTDVTSLLSGAVSKDNASETYLSLAQVLEVIVNLCGVTIENDRDDHKTAIVFDNMPLKFFLDHYKFELGQYASEYPEVKDDKKKVAEFKERYDSMFRKILDSMPDTPVANLKMTGDEITEKYGKK